jgi:hypothetical protein
MGSLHLSAEDKLVRRRTEVSDQKKLNRRDFLKGAAVSGAGFAAAGALGATSAVASNLSAPGSSTIPDQWDYEADVVVLGTGLAGLSAAITAKDAGAKVLILEKLPQKFEGGSSRVSANYVFAPTDAKTGAPDIENGILYLKALACGSVEDEEIFRVQSEGYAENLAAIKALGGTLGTLPGLPSVPKAPGAQCYHQFAIALPDAPMGTVVAGYPVASSGDYKLWQLYRDNVASRNIDIMYECPAKELIQNPTTSEILGVSADNKGTTVTIKAKLGVILACGGVEFAPDLQKQYWPAAPVYSTGTPGNTGDGVRMAQKVGADLWHMNFGFASYGAFIIPGNDPLVTGVVPASARGISVDKLGNRFNMGNAVNGPLGGFGNELGVNLAFDSTTLDWNSLPCWAIFDDKARLLGPIMSSPQVASTKAGVSGKSGWFSLLGIPWSADNSEEVKKGWILSANSLSELATQIASDPDNKGKMTPAALEATVAAWNQDCADKTDSHFFTSPTTLVPISGPPFYAMKLWPNNVNPAAGPRRDKQCQVLDSFKQPIPRLYSAGELGAFWGWLQSSGSHLAECLFTGRIAGRIAATAEPWG